ncbi:relaxase/mobilization nuclease domain-containing protein [Streptomyces sp. NPDC093108]|uniref:relaxase/mobilization nuclease domain-containing protein n=1 Tax=unclassified Streptomyces TaxID=2593676 RepID=UPI003804AD14
MIANITKGRRAVGALIYDFGPGRRDEHINPRIVAGNVTGTPLQVARAIDHTARRRPEITAPIWRCSLSLPDEDGILPDAQWSTIAADFIASMGFDGAPWVAVRHGDDHIHLTVSRVDWGGQLLTDRWDYRRAREAADRLEEEHGLVRAADRFRPEGPQVRNRELEAAKRRGRGPDTPVPPEREELRQIIREVRDASRGLGRDAFESGLEDAGVSFRANVASTGRMNGYSFSLPSWTDAAGEQVWVPASKVGRDLRWAQLKTVVGDLLPPDTLAPRVAAAAATSPTPSRVDNVHQDDVAEFVDQAVEMLKQGRIDRGTGLPEDHPALSSDPAARLLAQWKAKVGGQELPAEQLPTTAEPIPAWTDKRRRPHGRLATDAISREIKATQRKIAGWERARTAAEQAARRWDAQATGAVTGPRVQELHQLHARVTKAAPHIEAAATAAAAARGADTAANAARKVWREANALKDQTRLQLWRAKTSKKAETEKASTAGAAIHVYVEQARQARTEASKASEEARRVSGVRDPAAETERLQQHWPQLLKQAQSDDQGEAQACRDTELGAVGDLTRSIRGAETRIERLGEEAALRREMPEAQRKAEGRARRDAALQKVPASRRRKASPPGEQPAHLRRNRGPSAGGGPRVGR